MRRPGVVLFLADGWQHCLSHGYLIPWFLRVFFFCDSFSQPGRELFTKKSRTLEYSVSSGVLEEAQHTEGLSIQAPGKMAQAQSPGVCWGWVRGRIPGRWWEDTVLSSSDSWRSRQGQREGREVDPVKLQKSHKSLYSRGCRWASKPGLVGSLGWLGNGFLTYSPLVVGPVTFELGGCAIKKLFFFLLLSFHLEFTVCFPLPPTPNTTAVWHSEC